MRKRATNNYSFFFTFGLFWNVPLHVQLYMYGGGEGDHEERSAFLHTKGTGRGYKKYNEQVAWYELTAGYISTAGEDTKMHTYTLCPSCSGYALSGLLTEPPGPGEHVLHRAGRARIVLARQARCSMAFVPSASPTLFRGAPVDALYAPHAHCTHWFAVRRHSLSGIH